MKKLFSIKYTAGAVNFAMLLLRVGLGTLMILSHGYQKITHFSATAEKIPNLLGMGTTINTTLIIFAEFFFHASKKCFFFRFRKREKINFERLK